MTDGYSTGTLMARDGGRAPMRAATPTGVPSNQDSRCWGIQGLRGRIGLRAARMASGHRGGSVLELIVSLIFTFVVLVFSGVVTLLSLLVPMVIMAAVGWIVYKRIESGDATIVVSGPLAQAMMASQKPSAPRRMKKVTCPSCGASKLQKAKTAWLYCDYCGSLVDWDFRRACETAGSSRPGPAYEAILRTEGPKQVQAKTAGDRDAYAASNNRVFSKHMEACPASYSPRLGDPAYRSAVLEYTVKSYTNCAFDDRASNLESIMQDAVKHLKWTGGFGSARQVSTESLMTLIAAFCAHQERWFEVNEAILGTHPDQPSASLLKSIGGSAFAQGWMPYVDGAGQEQMIERLGLGGEYIEPVDVETSERHCGGCASVLAVVEGARKVICESCGRMNNVKEPEIACIACSSPLSRPFGVPSFSCPKCEAEIRVEGEALSVGLSL